MYICHVSTESITRFKLHFEVGVIREEKYTKCSDQFSEFFLSFLMLMKRNVTLNTIPCHSVQLSLGLRDFYGYLSPSWRRLCTAIMGAAELNASTTKQLVLIHLYTPSNLRRIKGGAFLGILLYP